METDQVGGFENSNKYAHENALEAFSTWADDAFGKFYMCSSIIKCLTNQYIDDSKSDIKDEEDDKPAHTEKKKKIKKDPWELRADMEGNPMLPALDVCPKREALKSLIRSMTTMAYSKHCPNTIDLCH
jgi:hypothetical protein